jgi:predicted nucleotide-binding protein (sugar kinase/HSP70/actin superfamily)
MTQEVSLGAERKRLPIVARGILGDDAAGEPLDDAAITRALDAYERAESERLGLRRERRQWVDAMVDPKVARQERDQITMLLGGLTKAQDFLVEGALRGVGYKVQHLSVPDGEALQYGKEYGNRAQCNPTYFTVGNLVKHLCKLRDEQGLTAEEVVRRYVFLTAGACGPCRFGMYVTEYRKALRDAGFDGFRVMLFQQQGGLSQATGEEAGIDMSPAFFIAILKALVAGDVLNAVGYRIRPYEIEPGATDRALEQAKRICYRALYKKQSILVALFRSRRLFDAIRVDKLRARAKTAIIGEFWAMTTEGDGNYHLQRFLESEGAECDIQLTSAWLLYNVWEVARDTRVRAELREADGGKSGLRDLEGEFDVGKRLAALRLADAALRVAFHTFALPAGLFGYHLPDMDEVAEVAEPFYSNDLRGGEGHMEVGKLILNVVHSKAHMTLSVKPFGCMPSSGVSDGVQSLITSRYPGTIFCAVETSGDGAANFYSRVQMYLYKARIAAEEELARAFEETGVTRADVEAFLARNPRYASPLHHAPHHAAGSAASLVHELAPLIKLSRRERIGAAGRATALRARATLAAAPARLRALWRRVADPGFRRAVRVDLDLAAEIVRGKARDRFAPLVRKLASRAYFGSEAPVEPEALAAE